MNTSQIPSAHQLAAARLLHWHQSAFARKSLGELPIESHDGSSHFDNGPENAESASPEEKAEDSESFEAGSEETPDEKTASVAPDADGEIAPSAGAAVATSAALLTQEAVRSFVNAAGLLLFAPSPQLSAAPAPSFVEAVLGSTNASPTLAETARARTLLGRLIVEGSVLPLNLLGAPATSADTPDFVVSAAAFPFLFTLRGDKTWKQLPETSGPTKVSPLAVNALTLLIGNGPQSAYALVGELGKEVTETAVLRALSELWQHLRVIPVAQPNGKPAVWEPITSRFTKQLKAGANAGAPAALSAFISLYLGQVFLATEDEIEVFLSPVAPRSRVRDVLRGLAAARQLETVTIDGKHHHHLAGELPSFAAAAPEHRASIAEMPQFAGDDGRIRKFVAKPRKVGTGFVERGKPFRAGSDRNGDARPVRKPAAKRPVERGAGPRFDKPWEEGRPARFAGAPHPGRVQAEAQGSDRKADAGTGAPANRPGFERKPAFAKKPGSASKTRFGGDRPAFGQKPRLGSSDRSAIGQSRDDRADRASRREFTPRDSSAPRREFRPRPDGDSRPPRRDFAARPDSDSGAPRKPFGKPSLRKPGFGKPSGFSRSGGEDRPRSFGSDRPSRGASGEGSAPRRDSKPASSGAPFRRDASSAGDRDRRPFTRDRNAEGMQEGGRPPFRRFDAPRTPRASRDESDSRPYAGSLPKRPFSGRDEDRSGGGANSRPSFGKREGGSAAKQPFGGKNGFAGKPARGLAGKVGGGFSARSASGTPARPGGFAGKKPFSKAGSPVAGENTFDKFKGGNKPWGKRRPPARKFKPGSDEASRTPGPDEA